MHLLAISGSVRAHASNTALLDAAALVVPPGVTVARYPTVAALPHFDPDLDTPDGGALPGVVAELRACVGRADGLLLSTPEYAHGLPGSFKNALDWLVGSVELPGKPVAVLSPSARSVHAPAQLREVLTTMSARLVGEVAVVPLPRREMDAAAIAADATLGPLLRSVVSGFVRAIGELR